MIDRYHAELEALVERACTAAVERAYKCPGASVCCNPSWCKTASKCMRLEDERMRPKPVAWRDNEGLLETVETLGNLTSVIRGAGYMRPGSIACQLQDNGNGFIVIFPGHGSCDTTHCISLDYAQARELVLALTPHAKALGFAV